MRCCDIAYNAALTSRPSHQGVQIRFLSARAHWDSVCCSRSGDGLAYGEIIPQPFFEIALGSG